MISKSSLQAIKALAELAKLPEGQFAGAVSIAEKIQAPTNYLGKLLQQLAAYGVVISQKGVGGGFRLGKAPDKISLYDVVECLEDIDRWSRCFMGNEQCSDSAPCSAHLKWKAIREANLNFLKEITLANL